MPNTISVVEINYEDDLVTARQRARQVSRLLTFVEQDQTRISTAVSEIARLFVHSKRPAIIEFQIEGTTSPQLLLVDIGWSRGGTAKSGSMTPSNGRNLDPEWESAVTSARAARSGNKIRSASNVANDKRNMRSPPVCALIALLAIIGRSAHWRLDCRPIAY